MELIAGICLLIQGIRDIRTKEIPLWVSLCLGGGGFLYSIYSHRDWLDFCLGLLPGIGCLLLGYCTRQAVGYGDGILLCALGMLYSVEELLYICMVAACFAGITGLVLLVCFKKKGTYEIPFVPFLFVGWMFLYIQQNMAGGWIS